MTSAELTKVIPELKDLEPAESQSMLPQILHGVGAVVAAFFEEFPNTTCTERVTSVVRVEFGARAFPPHAVRGGLRSYEAKYNYVALAQTGVAKARLREFRTDRRGRLVRPDPPNKVITTGFAAMCEHFHPELQPDSRFHFLGRQMTEKQETYVVAFAQRPALARRFTSVEFGGRTEVTFWQGIAWIDPVTFRILRLRTDLEPRKRVAGVLKETTKILYSEVSFEQGSTTLWLPREVTVTGQFNQYLFQNRHRYSDYRLFKVSVQQNPGS